MPNILGKPIFAASLLSLVASPLLAGAAVAQNAPYPSNGGYDDGQYSQGGYDQPPQGYDDNGGGYDDDAPPPQQSRGYPPPQGQGYPPPQGQGYQGQGYQGQGYPPPQQGYDNEPAPPPAPPGYDGTQPPPPPPGYQAGPDAAQQQAADQQYASYAQQWAQAYCVKAHGDAGQGALIGGIAGAILGSAIGGRGNHGTGALAGAAVGAAGGAVVGDASGSNATSPGCPPGYVVRGGAPAFSYGGYGGAPYAYAAPGWYRPWVYYGGAWVYRPYPYHVWYYGHYGPRYHGYYGRRWHGGYRRRW